MDVRIQMTGLRSYEGVRRSQGLGMEFTAALHNRKGGGPRTATILPINFLSPTGHSDSIMPGLS
jgi:hypothetical protein